MFKILKSKHCTPLSHPVIYSQYEMVPLCFAGGIGGGIDLSNVTITPSIMKL